MSRAQRIRRHFTHRMIIAVASAGFAMAHAVPAAAQEVEQSGPIATIERPAFFVRDADAATRFFVEVLGYKFVASWTDEVTDPENGLKVPVGTKTKTVGLRAHDGATTIAIIGLDGEDIPTLEYPEGFTHAYGGVMFLYRLTNIKAAYDKIVELGYPVDGSPDYGEGVRVRGHLFVQGPGNVRFELYEIDETIPYTGNEAFEDADELGEER